MLQRATSAVIDHHRDGNQTTLAHGCAVRQNFFINVTHGGAINVEITDRNLAHNTRAAVDKIHHNTILRKHHTIGLNTSGNSQFLIGT